MMPNFFMVGAAKSGTTSLWQYLRQHPEIFFPVNKEPNFFAYEDSGIPSFSGPADPEELYRKLFRHTITESSAYEALFCGVESEKAVGEASVRYLYFPQASEKIHQALPDSKIIIMLRNPVARLYSHFLMMKGMYSLEPLDLEEALEQENERVSAGWDWDWHYVRVSMYFEQVNRYIKKFGSSNVRVLVYEDFCQHPLEVIQEVYEFLEVDADFVPDLSIRSMQTYWPKSSRLDWLLRTPNRINSVTKSILSKPLHAKLVHYGMVLNKGTPPVLPSPMREQLRMTFQQDVLNLENLLGRELPW